jgi:phage FluMu gp28-like protein
MRGFTFDYLVCDEFAFMDEKAWTEVLRATVLVKGKKVLLISTPKGKNHFYKMYQLDGINEQYKSFTMTSYHNPMINPKEIDDAKLTLPDMVFRQEYLAEFVDGTATLFNNRQIVDSKANGRAFAGIDLGRADDYSVLSIFNEKGEQFYIERWRHTDWQSIVKNIAQGLRTNFVQTALVEVNSIGDVIFEMLQKECASYCTIEPFVTTNQSKKQINTKRLNS